MTNPRFGFDAIGPFRRLDDGRALRELLELARIHGRCNECGKQTAMDYCRTCDEFYWIHHRGCGMFTDKHFGHRLTIVPYTEER